MRTNSRYGVYYEKLQKELSYDPYEGYEERSIEDTDDIWECLNCAGVTVDNTTGELVAFDCGNCPYRN